MCTKCPKLGGKIGDRMYFMKRMIIVYFEMCIEISPLKFWVTPTLTLFKLTPTEACVHLVRTALFWTSVSPSLLMAHLYLNCSDRKS